MSQMGSSRTSCLLGENTLGDYCGWEAVVSDKTSPIGRLGWIQIDTSDPERLAGFWKLTLGVEIEGRLGSPPQS